MADNRIALDNGSVLALTDEKMIGIVSEIGRGATVWFIMQFIMTVSE